MVLTPHKPVRLGATIAGCALIALCLLYGCASTGHQIIKSNEECASCHSQDIAEYEVVEPKQAQRCESHVTVKAEADEIVVCEVRFTAEDGSAYVPVEKQRIALDGGEASLNLGEGLWALAIDNGDSSKSTLLMVDSQNGGTDSDANNDTNNGIGDGTDSDATVVEL